MARRRKKGLTPGKAREMLHDGTAHGRKLTDKQRGYFGLVASGKTPRKAKRGKRRR